MLAFFLGNCQFSSKRPGRPRPSYAAVSLALGVGLDDGPQSAPAAGTRARWCAFRIGRFSLNVFPVDDDMSGGWVRSGFGRSAGYVRSSIDSTPFATSFSFVQVIGIFGRMWADSCLLWASPTGTNVRVHTPRQCFTADTGLTGHRAEKVLVPTLRPEPEIRPWRVRLVGTPRGPGRRFGLITMKSEVKRRRRSGPDRAAFSRLS